MRTLEFDITEDPDAGYCAAAVGERIFTQGDTWEELRANLQDATKVHFLDTTSSEQIKLVLRREEFAPRRLNCSAASPAKSS